MLKQSLSSEELLDFKKSQQKLFFPSSFGFLKAHNGIRTDAFHMLMGCMGSGKSALVKKIISETAEAAPVTVMTSEETQLQYNSGIADINCDPSILKNISFFEERNIPEEVLNNHKQLFDYLTETVLQSGAKVWFIDNVTTSKLYSEESTFRDHAKTARFLYDFPKKHGVGVFAIAHFGKHVTKNYHRLCAPEDIRGSNALPIRTEYCYIMNTYEWETTIYNIIQNAKYRGHIGAGGFWRLNWLKTKYRDDTPINFERLREIFKGRNRL